MEPRHGKACTHCMWLCGAWQAVDAPSESKDESTLFHLLAHDVEGKLVARRLEVLRASVIGGAVTFKGELRVNSR